MASLKITLEANRLPITAVPFSGGHACGICSEAANDLVGSYPCETCCEAFVVAEPCASHNQSHHL